VEYGLDVNSNNVIDATEINATLTKYICNGTAGATGAQGPTGLTGATGPQGIQGVAGAAGATGTAGKNTLAKTTTEVAGANCATGGVKVEYGLDVNSNNVLDVSEINATLTKYICNGTAGATGAQGPQGIQGVAGTAGAPGAAGKNTLAKTTTEVAGANCAAGGLKVEYGLDINSNNVLDVSEINEILTKYICNGIAGATGAQGPIGLTGATGAQGIQGAAGTAGASGATGAAGKNTLAKTTSEVAGANCAAGGVKVEYGLDLNSNNILDVSEINATLTKYICNGTVGATGAQGPTGLTGLAGATGATGAQGIAGTNGTNGTNGLDGKNTLFNTTPETTGANCANGGVKVEYGLDVNSNNVLDVSEINATLTKYVCNGTAGATGETGSQGVAGPTGAQGLIGLTGPQGLQGIAGTNGTNGINGLDGKNTLANSTIETVGLNCAAGGIKVEYGLDVNNNNVLDVSEIDAALTQYICNGTAGAQGSQGNPGNNGQNTLITTTTEIAGVNCPAGGVKLEYGLDANNNNLLDVFEINTTMTKFICNGITDGTGAEGPQGIQGIAGSNGINGLNALINTTWEAAGANCANGGTKIEVGLDNNGNGMLDVVEINDSQTKFVCNGAAGPQGQDGSNVSNDSQQLSVSTAGDTLKLQNGGFVIIPGISAANTPINQFFTPGSGVSDIDGNNYQTLIYSGQFAYDFQIYSKMEWMAQNLKTTTYSNGDAIPQVQDNTWDGLTSGAWCWFESNPAFDIPQGKLYNWYTVNDSRNVCPSGWHVSTLQDWFKLNDVIYSNGFQNSEIDQVLKSQNGWDNNLNGTNESGFSAYPSGSRLPGAFYFQMGFRANWWRIEEWSTTTGGTIQIDATSGYGNSNTEKYIGNSIRCVRYSN